MKIACTGFVKRFAGSLSQANFILLEELLKRGYKIDFYGWPGFNEPLELLVSPNFRYIPVPDGNHFLPKLLRLIPRRIYNLIIPFLNILVFDRLFYGDLLQEVLRRHQRENYDLLCFLGLSAPVKTDVIPVISWVQAAPQTEWFYLHKLRRTLIKYCGMLPYLAYKIFYAIKTSKARQDLDNSQLFICPSPWTKDQMIDYGVSPHQIYALPHPIDTNLFDVKPITVRSQEITFLYLGRINTRKRLDLLLDAFALLGQERSDVRLKVCGSTSNMEKGYMRLLENLPYADRIEYVPYIPQSEVPALMSACDFLVQPSEGENFGSSVGEALCCGTPVILGISNGTKDYAGGAAFVFEEYTPESLKASMLKAIHVLEQQPEQLITDSRNAAEMYLSVPTVTKQFEEILQKFHCSVQKPVISSARHS
jgi:glycosyltransferase involved in cell wall biosynthesis